MAWTKEELLVKVRALIAKGNSTEFEAEKQLFLAKADELMEKYAIDVAMLAQADESKAKLVIRRDMDISWWKESRSLPWEVRSELFWLWGACLAHCRCISSQSVWDYTANTSAVYGLPSDLDYLDLLFTDLMLQMFAKVKPTYDPSKTLGHNVAIGKQAGMKYADIATWVGMPELVRISRDGKRQVDGKLLREYKKHIAAHGGDLVTIHPTTWMISFAEGFCYTIRKRLREIRKGREEAKDSSNPMALALRDVRDLAQEQMYVDFPELRPHEPDCKCEQCKPSKRRRVATYKDNRQRDWVAQSRGSQAGESARIVSNDPTLRKPRELK